MIIAKSQNFNFSAEPRIAKPKSKYREQSENAQLNPRYQNIMFEKRVFRGNTHGNTFEKEFPNANLSNNKKSSVPPPKMKKKNLQLDDIDTYDALDNAEEKVVIKGIDHCHKQSNTDEYVEVITAKALCYEQEVQTEFKIDRPPIRLFTPRKTGIDKETQIYEGELFDFEKEVEPILEAICGRTLEQSRMEVLEEQELKTMQEQMKQFEQIKIIGLAEVQKYEMHERRMKEETDRRNVQYAKVKEQKLFSHKRMVSRMIGKEYARKFFRGAFNNLDEQGFFKSTFEITSQAKYVPWVSDKVISGDTRAEDFNQFVDSYLSVCESYLKDLHREALENQKRKILEKKINEERLKNESIQRKKKREEDKLKKAESDRREAILQKIKTALSKSEVKDDFYTQIMSDIDSLGDELPTVGFLGGVVFEIALLLTTLKNLAKSTDEQLAKLKNFQITSEFVQKILIYILNEYYSNGGVIELCISPETLISIKSVNPECKIEDLFVSDPTHKEAIFNILKTSLSSFGITFMKEHFEALEITDDIVGIIIEKISHLVLNDENQSKRFKIIVQKNNPLDDTKTLVRLKPLIELEQEELPSVNDRECLLEEEEKKKKSEGKKSKYYTDYTEAPLEGKVTMMKRKADEISLFIIHYAPQILFRKDIIYKLCSVIKELKDLDTPIVQNWMKLGESADTMFMEKVKHFDYFEIDSY